MIPIDVLLIDDEKDYCKVLKANARKFGIKITDFQNLEDGFYELEESPKYKGVILDARCIIQSDNNKSGSAESDDFLAVALMELQKLEQKLDRHIPFVVNTGYLDNFTHFQTLIERSRGKLFRKTSDKEALFQYLLQEIANTKNTKIEKQYSDIFEIFTKDYLPERDYHNLLDILKKMDSSNPSERKSTLSSCRNLVESIYQEIHEQIGLPNFCFERRTGNLMYRKVSEYLAGSPRRPDYEHNPVLEGFTKTVRQISDAIYSISSEVGSHSSYEATPPPSKYGVQGIVNLLLELLLWFKEEMENK